MQFAKPHRGTLRSVLPFFPPCSCISPVDYKHCRYLCLFLCFVLSFRPLPSLCRLWANSSSMERRELFSTILLLSRCLGIFWMGYRKALSLQETIACNLQLLWREGCNLRRIINKTMHRWFNLILKRWQFVFCTCLFVARLMKNCFCDQRHQVQL